MRQHLARIIWASSLAGCSLIYNPNNLPDKNSMPADAMIADADPSMLELTEVKSTDLLEGAGQSGSAPQILVVYGHHILKDAMVTIVPSTPNAAISIQVSNVSIADDGNSFAALVRAGYMDGLDETGVNASPPIPLTITVTQAGADPKTIAWMLKPLDELEPGMQAVPPAGRVFSRIDATGDIDFMVGPDRAILEVVGGVTVTGRVSANAVDTAAGPGGCNGAAANQDAPCLPAGGKRGAGGGGGGFGTAGTNGGTNTAGMMTGTETIAVYNDAHRGGGGGGGAVEGGGSGGTIEITAGGDIIVNALEARGAGGVSGGTLGAGGGGGSGGLIVLRAGGTLTHAMMLDLSGGAGGGGTLGAGGNGGQGRFRFDAAKTMGTMPATPAPSWRGPMVVRPANPIFEVNEAALTISGNMGDQVDLITQHADGTSDTQTETLTGAMSQVEVPLRIGLNTVCVLVPGGNLANDVAKNCLEVAFIP